MIDDLLTTEEFEDPDPEGNLDQESETSVASEDDVDLEPMREMVLYIARTLSREPDGIELSEEVDDGQVIFNLTVSDEDKGRIIGKEGRTAQALRSLLRVAGVKYGIRTRLEIV